MTGFQVEIQLIAAVAAVACALPGVFLVLRRMALMSDAISHSILLGIVLAFFVVENLSSPLLIAGAAATGVLTVWLVELTHRTRLVREDAAIGLVFPALFSVGVVLIARYAGSVHLDVDAVLLGELAFAPFRRLSLGGVDLGPQALWVMSAILVLNLGFVLLFYKELELTTFDAALAASLGISPALMHYGFMTLVSITAVGAFDAVGSVLVIALMIAPPAAAYLLTERLPAMIAMSAAFGLVAAIAGYWLAHALDASLAGSMATVAGALFVVTWMIAPHRGVVAQVRRRAMQRLEFATRMLVIHLHQHEGSADAEVENRVQHLQRHLRWKGDFADRIVRAAERRELLASDDAGALRLTDRGRELARVALTS